MEYSINFPLNKTNNKWSYHIYPTICIYRSIPVILRLMDCRKFETKYCLVHDVNNFQLIEKVFFDIRLKAMDNRPFFVGKSNFFMSELDRKGKRERLLYFFYDLYNEKLEESIFQDIYIYKTKLLVYQYAKTGIISSTISIPGDELQAEDMIINNLADMYSYGQSNDFDSLKEFHEYLTSHDDVYKNLGSNYDITMIVATDLPTSKVKFTMNMFDNSMFLQLFSIESLMFCLLDHVKICEHEIVTDAEFNEFCKSNGISAKKENLSMIPSNDEVAKFIGLRPKQICKKIRRCENNGKNISFYNCVNSSSQFYTTRKKKKDLDNGENKTEIPKK